MKKVLLCAASIAAFTSAAFAADLPSRRAPPVFVPPPVPTFTWEGFYFGVNAGADFNNYDSYRQTGITAGAVANLATGVRDPLLVTRSTGFAGGGQIGYNFNLDGGFIGSSLGIFSNTLSPIFGGRAGGPIFGVEADIDATTNVASALYIGTTNLATSYRSHPDFVGTARGRLGYAFGNVFVYGTGGLAYANVRDSIIQRDAAGGVAGVGSTSGLRLGIAYGGGIEYAIPTASFVNFFKASAVTVKAEFIHYELGSTTVAYQSGTNTYNVRFQEKGNLARLGVNYKFGGVTPTPVVARY